jgi:predicted nucleic acid-binding protein
MGSRRRSSASTSPIKRNATNSKPKIGKFFLLDFPKEALFLAGKVFLRYKKRHGKRRFPLPDFFIGAHAAVMELALLTRDARRYQSYFSAVPLISPDRRR